MRVNLFFIKNTFIKKRPKHICFLMNLGKFLRTPIVISESGYFWRVVDESKRILKCIDNTNTWPKKNLKNQDNQIKLVDFWVSRTDFEKICYKDKFGSIVTDSESIHEDEVRAAYVNDIS